MAFTVTRVPTVSTSSLTRRCRALEYTETNVWVVGDDAGLVVIDAAHDAQAIADVVDHRRVQAIICTNGHHDQINAAPELSDVVTAPIYLAAADRPLWDQVHPTRTPYDELRDGDVFRVGDELIYVVPTPGYSPGGICLYVPGQSLLFSGGTLVRGGPGNSRAANRNETGPDSIPPRLLALPPATIVHPAHGADTTLGEAAPTDATSGRQGRVPDQPGENAH